MPKLKYKIMSKEWFPIIDYDKCNGCLTCYNKCKHRVYELKEDKPAVIFREGCIAGCHGCGNICPQQAIIYSGEYLQKVKCACHEEN